MKLVRFGEKGKERPGLWQDGRIIDLDRYLPGLPDIGEQFFREGWLNRVAEVNAQGGEMAVRLGAPVARPGKIICIGKNYADHAREGGMAVPEKPLLFCKTGNTVNGPYDPIRLPTSAGQVDWEVELAVVIGREGKGIARDAAMDFVAGYTIMNDVSAREAQFGDGQWFRGKSFDTFAPMGPVLLTADGLGDPPSVRLTCHVNGRLMQEGTLDQLMFDIPALIAYISRDITLMPGDVISTGTPSGVGIFRDPPVLLAHGDEVTCRIAGIGTIRNRVEAG